MNGQSVPDRRETTASAAILIDAVRCWREASDAGDAVQPCLSRALAVHDCTILAPVLDSLAFFYEFALGRRIAVGKAARLSDDEHLLLRLLDGASPRACIDCPEGRSGALSCALCSTRIMLALTLGEPTRMLRG